MLRYALVTAAYNEERLIEQTIRSIAAQTMLPAKWIIVSDGSTDRTNAIVEQYCAELPFLQLCRITEEHPRNFAAQVFAINRGLAQLELANSELIGNLDADVTLGSDYFSRLTAKFESDPKLGIGGGSICERGVDGQFRARQLNARSSVAHACQLFRRECLTAIGGEYVPLPYGGPDTYAEVFARMKSWGVETFFDLEVFHHRPTNGAEGAWKGWFRQGRMDYSLGSLPSFEVLKLARRALVKPYVLGAAVRCAGFLHCYCTQEERAVPSEFVTYLRSEQRRRVFRAFRRDEEPA